MFPTNEGTIYPSDTGHTNHVRKNLVLCCLDAWFDMMIPSDTTELVVYMSGFELYRKHLRGRCKAKGIKLTEMWIRPKLKKASQATTMNPNAYRAKVVL